MSAWTRLSGREREAGEAIFGSVVGGVTAAFTSATGANIPLSGAAGLLGFALPWTVDQVVRHFAAGGPAAMLKARAQNDFARGVLNYPRKSRDLMENVVASARSARLLRSDVFHSKDMLPKGAAWQGEIDPGARRVLGLGRDGKGRNIEVSCPLTCPGLEAVFLHMRDSFGVNIHLDYHSVCACEQLDELAIHSSLARDYDFLVTGGWSFLFKAANLSSFRLLFPVHDDRQYLLTRPTGGSVKRSSLSILSTVQTRIRNVYYIPESANQHAMLNRFNGGETKTPIEIEDLTGVAESLGAHDVLAAWNPNAAILMRRFGLEPIEAEGLPVPMFLAMSRELCHRRHEAFVSAFTNAFVAAWHACRKSPQEVYEKLGGFDEYRRAFDAAISALA